MGETLNLAKLYSVSTQTIRDWRRRGAPFHDPSKMPEFIAGLRSRWGVGKRFKRSAFVVPAAAEPSDDLWSNAQLVDFVTAMSSDIDRICGLIADAGKPLATANPEVYAAFQPLIELCSKWIEK
jgi:hypothetical protein